MSSKSFEPVLFVCTSVPGRRNTSWTHLNHFDHANENDASTASPQELKFEGCSPLTSVKITDLLTTFLCSRGLLLALLFDAEVVDLWMVENTDLMFRTRVF